MLPFHAFWEIIFFVFLTLSKHPHSTQNCSFSAHFSIFLFCPIPWQNSDRSLAFCSLLPSLFRLLYCKFVISNHLRKEVRKIFSSSLQTDCKKTWQTRLDLQWVSSERWKKSHVFELIFPLCRSWSRAWSRGQWKDFWIFYCRWKRRIQRGTHSPEHFGIVWRASSMFGILEWRSSTVLSGAWGVGVGGLGVWFVALMKFWVANFAHLNWSRFWCFGLICWWRSIGSKTGTNAIGRFKNAKIHLKS